MNYCMDCGHYKGGFCELDKKPAGMLNGCEKWIKKL